MHPMRAWSLSTEEWMSWKEGTEVMAMQGDDKAVCEDGEGSLPEIGAEDCLPGVDLACKVSVVEGLDLFQPQQPAEAIRGEAGGWWWAGTAEHKG